MKIKFIKILIIFAIFSLYNCDSDKYFGYNMNAQELLKSTIFEGQITHFYTHRPVTNAIIKMGTQETATDTNGFYHHKYIINEDELRNKPIELIVSAKDYESDSLTVLIDPIHNEYNFELKYLPPIIQESMRNYIPPSNNIEITLFCQAIVKDYQGWVDIQSVVAVFYNESNDELVRMPLEFIKNSDSYTGYYQVKYQGEANLSSYYSIIATDRENHEDSYAFADTPFDYFLFDPYSN